MNYSLDAKIRANISCYVLIEMEKRIRKIFHGVMIVLVLMTASVAYSADEESLLDLNQYKGKVVYVDFWASWCIPCRQSFPWMEKLQSGYKEQGLQIIAVNLDEDQQAAQKFLEVFDVSFDIVFDPKGSLAQKYDIQGMPTSLLFNREGELVSQHIGYKVTKQPKYEAAIEKLLAQ